MHIDTHNKNQIIDLIRESKNIAVIPAKFEGCDSYSAAAGLYHMLFQKYNDKKSIKFVYIGKQPKECLGLLKKGQIESNVSRRDLFVTINYSDTAAKKITYSNEKDTFHLKLGPVSKDFDVSNVKTKVSGFNFDLVFIIGARELTGLGPIYSNLKNELKNSKIVNIDTSQNNKRFGVVNVIDSTADSLSTLIFKMTNEWGLIPNRNSAKALLTGIAYLDKSIKNSEKS